MALVHKSIMIDADQLIEIEELAPRVKLSHSQFMCKLLELGMEEWKKYTLPLTPESMWESHGLIQKASP